MLRYNEWSTKKRRVAADEAHCMKKEYESNSLLNSSTLYATHTALYRDDHFCDSSLSIREVHSLMPMNVNLMALTATATRISMYTHNFNARHKRFYNYHIITK